MKTWTRIGLAVGVAVVVGGMTVGAVTWAQQVARFRAAGQERAFRGGFQAGRDFGGGRRAGARLLAALDNSRIKSALGLTDDQTSKLRQIIVGTQESNIKTGADLAVRRIELRELLRADNPDRDAVMMKVDEVSALRAELLKQDMNALLSAKSVLTPEQQNKIRTFIESRRAGMGMEGRAFGRRNGGPGDGPRFGPHPMNAPQAQTRPKAPSQP